MSASPWRSLTPTKSNSVNRGFAGQLAGAAAAHLLVKNGGAGVAGEDEIDDFGAVEAGVEHVDRDEDLREGLFEALDFGEAVGAVVGAEAGDDVVGVAVGGAGLRSAKAWSKSSARKAAWRLVTARRWSCR
jgi:hypothetical protein